ncbi:uncharacterized protein [Drosophila bipectinata]|uniref:uncharacterized protein n=1 Tax=Drosophila bipectinata TaxID=42026 RepID=UPI0038B3E4BD
MDQAILGVNLQIIHSSMSKAEIVIKTLGMIQLRHSHTGKYIQEKIMEIINDYGITLDQVFSITSDNGKNMIKAVQILNDGSDSLFDDNANDDINGEEVMEKLDSIQLANIHLVHSSTQSAPSCGVDIQDQEKEYTSDDDKCIVANKEESLLSAYLDGVQTISEVKEDPASKKLVKIYEVYVED